MAIIILAEGAILERVLDTAHSISSEGLSRTCTGGAPMTLIRGGEERDLAAIVAMGRIRAEPFRFHLDRDVEFEQYAITRKRLLAGAPPRGPF